MQADKQTSLKGIIYFPRTEKNGIPPTRFIVEKDVDYSEGLTVHVNWEGKKVAADILALSGEFLLQHFMRYFLKSLAVKRS